MFYIEEKIKFDCRTIKRENLALLISYLLENARQHIISSLIMSAQAA